MKAIITVIGKDTTGIIYNVSKVLNRLKVNIEDISQTVLQQEYFTMLMLVKIDENKCSFKEVKDSLSDLSKSMNLSIQIQKEDIFDAMHTI